MATEGASGGDTAKIFSEFSAAATLLFARREAFSDAAKWQEKKLGVRQLYKDNLRKMVKLVAGKQTSGANSFFRSADYKSCSEILNDHRSFVEQTEKQIVDKLDERERQLKDRSKTGKKKQRAAGEGDDFVVRISSLPMNTESINLIKWMSGEYRNAVPAVNDKLEETLASFNQCTKKLPMSYEEYADRGTAFFSETWGLSTSKKRRKALEMFPRLSRFSPIKPVPSLKPK